MSDTIANKIKQLREAAGLSVADLAEAAGINEPQIELIENGSVMPSISTLIKIARRIGVRLGTILDGVETTTPIITKASQIEPTISTSNANTSSRNHLDFFSLAGRKSDRNMEPFIVNVQFSDTTNENDWSRHEGEEFIFVLEGSVKIHYGTELYSLDAGDSIYYDSIVPHLITTQGESQSAKVLAVTYTPY